MPCGIAKEGIAYARPVTGVSRLALACIFGDVDPAQGVGGQDIHAVGVGNGVGSVGLKAVEPEPEPGETDLVSVDGFLVGVCCFQRRFI